MRSGMAAASGGAVGREGDGVSDEEADGRAEGLGLWGEEAEREVWDGRADGLEGEGEDGRVASHVRAEAETAERRQRREGRSMWAGLWKLMRRGRGR